MTTEDAPTRQELIERRINTDIAGAVALSELGVMFRDMGQVMEFAKMMAVSGPAVPLAFRNNPGACLAAALKAHHLGFEPFSFASKCYMVNDQLAYEAQLINAIIIRRGPFAKRPSVTYSGVGAARKCKVVLHFAGDSGDREYESPEIGNIKPQNSPLWKTDPDQQLGYYSIRAAARRWCPDVILGMYDTEEMAAVVARDVTPAKVASPVADLLANGTKLQAVRQSPVQTEDAPQATTLAADPVLPRTEPATPPGVHSDGGDVVADASRMDFPLQAEIETALADCTTVMQVDLLLDEFDTALGTAADPAALRRLFDARRQEIAGT